MGATLRTALRACGFAAGAFILAAATGCAGSSARQSGSSGQSSGAQDAAQDPAGVSHTSIDGVRIDWRRERDGHVCYAAKLPRSVRADSLGSCARRLRANEITYVIGRQPKTRQLMIVGVKGPRVAKVYLRFRAKRWTPPVSRGAFFGYIPRGKVLSVVKVLKNGVGREFAVNLYSA
jgi:hypothetical protein